MRVPAPTRLLRMPLACALLAGVFATQARPTQAQVAPDPVPEHVYPMGSEMGYARFSAGPGLQINCVSYPLGPGLRVHDPQQHLVLRGQLAGLHGPAVFARDSMGNVFQVWMLAPGQVLPKVPAAPNRCLFQQY